MCPEEGKIEIDIFLRRGRHKAIEFPLRTSLTIFRNIRSSLNGNKIHELLRLKRTVKFNGKLLSCSNFPIKKRTYHSFTEQKKEKEKKRKEKQAKEKKKTRTIEEEREQKVISC